MELHNEAVEDNLVRPHQRSVYMPANNGVGQSLLAACNLMVDSRVGGIEPAAALLPVRFEVYSVP